MRFFGNSSYHTLWFCKTSKHYSVGFLSFVWLRFHNAPCPSVFVHEIFRLRNSFQHHLPSDRLNHPNCDLSSDDRLVYLECLPNIYRPTTKLGEGNVFSRVCLSIHVGVPCDHYPWCTGLHHTWPSQALASPPPKHGTSLYREPPRPDPAPQCWHLVANKALQSAIR